MGLLSAYFGVGTKEGSVDRSSVDERGKFISIS